MKLGKRNSRTEGRVSKRLNFERCDETTGIADDLKTSRKSDFCVSFNLSKSDSKDMFEEDKSYYSNLRDLSPIIGLDLKDSPIRKIRGINSLTPDFKIHRRQRTSTRVVPNNETKTQNSHTLFSSSVDVSKRARLGSVCSDSCDSDDSGRYSPVEITTTVPDISQDYSGRCSPNAEKRCRVSDLSISRYEEEFLELSEVASGEFGCVLHARHRLDGGDYAVKVNKKMLIPGSYQEKKAMREVLAHASLNNHQHVVRYYTSWVEEGRVFIQNEFCGGGSLEDKIREKRLSSEKFSEEELKKILRHTLAGLQYIHSNNMAHLDMKPGNILLTHTENGDYKIGDLGHVTDTSQTNLCPEEGDCRYMAPEFLLMEMDTSQLDKADIFSLGLTLYEAASLKLLPKNSLEDAEYTQIKAGQLPYLASYSPEMNRFLSSMVKYHLASRPSATELLRSDFLTKQL